MPEAMVRIGAGRRDQLKIIARMEGTTVKRLLSGLIDEYIERCHETLELLCDRKHRNAIMAGKKEVRFGVKGKSLADPEN
jgi:hypothetical protein